MQFIVKAYDGEGMLEKRILFSKLNATLLLQ